MIAGQVGQHGKELVGALSVGGDESVGPKVGDLALAQLGQCPGREVLNALDQRDAHHVRKRP